MTNNFYFAIYVPMTVRILRDIQVDNIKGVNILQNNVILRYDTNRNSEISGLSVIYWNFLWNKCLNYKFIHILRLTMFSLHSVLSIADCNVTTNIVMFRFTIFHLIDSLVSTFNTCIQLNRVNSIKVTSILAGLIAFPCFPKK